MHIEHVAIWTRDIDRLKAFYETYFEAQAGAKYTNAAKQFESYFLTFAQETRLELMQMPTVPDSQDDPEAQFTGYIHLAISVGSAQRVDELTARLRADGHRVMDEPRQTGDGYYESIVRDPDGNQIEITI